MKIKRLGIKGLPRIGVADIDVYGTGLKPVEKEKVKLRIGVFFDGTGNNRFNSDSIYYNDKYSKLPLDESRVPKINRKSFVIESGSSYWNSYSNIALLHDLYEESPAFSTISNIGYQTLGLRFYIQGIGTLRDEKDDKWGSGMGEGKRGVIARVQQACQEIADRIETIFIAREKETNQKLEIVSIQFDVFGFSRGAAAARHFCNEVLKSGKSKTPEYGGGGPPLRLMRPVLKKNQKPEDNLPDIQQYKAESTKKIKDNTKVVQKINAPENNVFIGGNLGDFLRKKGINYPKYNVSVEFLGIFDTVISQMLEKKGIIDNLRNPIINALVTTLNPVWGPIAGAVALIKKIDTRLSNPNIKRILHLKAQTEWRDNFPITPIGKFNGIFAKELTVLGAHSDIGGAYWQTEKELETILHFFDLAFDASVTEKQKMEQQKNLLRKWYISQKLCREDQISWKTFHHVHSFEGHIGEHPSTDKKELLPEDFMGNDTEKTTGNRTYLLQGYHYKLVSTRALNNKLSLVYMNVMKYIASQYAEVPFNLSTNETPHPEEYILPEGDKKEKDLKSYEKLIREVAEHGWMDKNGKIVTYPNLVKNKLYPLSSEMHEYIMGNFVHLSANFNSPLIGVLDHYNLAYANVPNFTDKKEFKDPPYQREPYSPDLVRYDIS